MHNFIVVLTPPEDQNGVFYVVNKPSTENSKIRISVNICPIELIFVFIERTFLDFEKTKAVLHEYFPGYNLPNRTNFNLI